MDFDIYIVMCKLKMYLLHQKGEYHALPNLHKCFYCNSQSDSAQMTNSTYKNYLNGRLSYLLLHVARRTVVNHFE